MKGKKNIRKKPENEKRLTDNQESGNSLEEKPEHKKDFMEKHWIMTSFLMTFTIICWLVLNGSYPYTLKSVFLPLFYEKQEIIEIIEDKEILTYDYSYAARQGVREGKNSYLGFYIDGYWVRVPEEDYSWYDEGEYYSFYVYTSPFGNEITRHEPYDVRTGLLLLSLLICTWGFLIWIIFIHTTEERKEKNRIEKEKLLREPLKIRRRHYIFNAVVWIIYAVILLSYIRAAVLIFDGFIF